MKRKREHLKISPKAINQSQNTLKRHKILIKRIVKHLAVIISFPETINVRK